MRYVSGIELDPRKRVVTIGLTKKAVSTIDTRQRNRTREVGGTKSTQHVLEPKWRTNVLCTPTTKPRHLASQIARLNVVVVPRRQGRWNLGYSFPTSHGVMGYDSKCVFTRCLVAT